MLQLSFVTTLMAALLAIYPLAAQTQVPPPNSGEGLSRFAQVMGGLSLLPPPRPLLSLSSSTTTKNQTIQYRLNAVVPAFRNEQNSVAATFNGNSLHLDQAYILSKTATRIARDFYRSEIGAQFSHQVDPTRHLGLRGSLGYASDKPFYGTKDLSFSLNGSYSFPGAENSLWVLTVFISNNSPIGNYIPIPGFIYFYKSETFTGIFGIPLASLIWTPIQPWSFSFSLFGPSLSLEAAYALESRMQIFIGANWSQQSFIRHQRIKNEDRLIFEEKRGFIGLKSPLSPALSGEVQLGQTFDRSLYEGDGFLNRDRGSVSIADSWFAQANLRCLF